jgi:TRAP transporter T-component
MRPFSLLAVLILAACGKQPGAYEVGATAAAPIDATTALKEHADTLWDLRADKTKLQEALAKYEQVLAADPTNREVAAKLARGWYFLGDAYETDKDAKLANWEKAISHGKSCLALNTEFTALLAKGDEDETTAARAFTIDDVPCMYWTSSALGKWAKMSGLGPTLKNLPTVKAYMTRVTELDSAYFHSGSDRYWGAYYAAIPSFAGQDLNKAKEHLDKSIAAAPTYLGTQVLLAEYWAVKTQNKAVFQETLNKVVAADANAAPDVVAENLAEQNKAKLLLAQEGDLFAQ